MMLGSKNTHQRGLAFGVIAVAAAFTLNPTANAQAQPEPQVPSAQDAPIALLVDVTSGQVLHARHPDRRFVPASITKTMTLFHAFELIEEGRIDPRQTYTLRPETWREWKGKGSTMWLGAKDEVTVASLLYGIANVSANDGSVVLAEGAAGSIEQWVEGMNARARALGMENSHFGTPNGWPDEGATFVTARDLVTLAQGLVTRHPEKFRQYIGHPTYVYNDIEQRNHDPLLGRIRGADGIKTGYTNEAGFGFLGTAQRDGQRLVMVVANSPQGRVRDRAARRYIEWGFEAFDRERLFGPDQVVDEARVQDGAARSVGLRTRDAVVVNVPSGHAGEIVASISYDGPLRAPIEEGARIATLRVEVPGLDDATIPLYAADAVEEAGFFARIRNGFFGWFG
ncbi:MAG: D-alanyl-D-alanine carboxypeptidase family protein [Erythrobacter sp.]|uniref:D-alanyl-D-alanine carboxypeptidase family protein n=1 Tax=Erythrobacter sp. TaxID=1042 RepID=UPI003C77EED8